MTAARTDAQALHDLLVAVRESKDTPSMMAAWHNVLQSDGDEFVRRHCEVIGLLASTIEQIDALPNEQQRNRLKRYVPAWWRAVMAPDHAWGGPQDTRGLLADADLDHLASAADIIENRMRASLAAPSGGVEKLADFRTICADWLGYLRDEAHDLPDALRQSLIKDLEHVTWLIDNANLFGMARVAEAGQRAVGGLVTVSAHVRGEDLFRWREMLNKTIGVLVTFSTLVITVDAALDAGGDMVGRITSVVSTEEVPGEPPGPRELRPGSEPSDSA
jgi:hypothetical protein